MTKQKSFRFSEYFSNIDTFKNMYMDIYSISTSCHALNVTFNQFFYCGSYEVYNANYTGLAIPKNLNSMCKITHNHNHKQVRPNDVWTCIACSYFIYKKLT